MAANNSEQDFVFLVPVMLEVLQCGEKTQGEKKSN